MNGCELKEYSNPLFGMRIDAGVGEIINSEINAEAPAAINIKAKKNRLYFTFLILIFRNDSTP